MGENSPIEPHNKGDKILLGENEEARAVMRTFHRLENKASWNTAG